eukprot:g5415.t1
MDRFASMHDEDIDKLGIPSQGAAGGEGGWRGRKRARELSQLKDRLDRAADKEQQSWDLLKQAVEKGGGAAADEGRFKATGTNRAAEEMRERTVGLVTADEFRKAREAADSLEEAEAKRRQEEEAAAEEAREAARRKAERKKKKAADKKKRLEKSKMSFALEEDEEEQDRERGRNRHHWTPADTNRMKRMSKPRPRAQEVPVVVLVRQERRIAVRPRVTEEVCGKVGA